MVSLSRVGFLGRLGGIGGNLLSPIFGPLITTLVNKFGGDSAGVAIRNSTATMRVYDSVAGSILKTVAINEHRPEGHRVVENLLSYPEDMTNATWGKNSAGSGVAPVVTLNYGISPDGSMTATRIQFDCGAGGGAGDYSRILQNALASVGIVSQSLYVKRIGVANPLLEFGYIGSANLTIPTTWTRISKNDSSGNAVHNMILRSSTSGADKTLDMLVWHPQLEDVTGLSNQNPSEYVGGTGAGPFRQVFTATSGITVASNIVSESGAKAPLFPTKTID